MTKILHVEESTVKTMILALLALVFSQVSLMSINNENSHKTVAIFGLGKLGLPTSIIMAKAGLSVIGIDTNKDRINKINDLKIKFCEKTFHKELKESLLNEKLKIAEKLEIFPDTFIICVPALLNGKAADLSDIFDCAEEISKNLKPGALVILQSTVPVGTTEKLERQIASLSGLKANEDFFVVYSPERFIPGRSEHEIAQNDRIIGASCPQTFILAKEFYELFNSGNLSFTDPKSAEFAKLIENISRSVEIAFANQVNEMALEFGLNPKEVIELANKHPRVNILNPGIGAGGHSMAIDPELLKNGLNGDFELLNASIEINKAKKQKIVDQILKIVDSKKSSSPEKFKILIFGLTYKSDVSDIDQSPALEIALKLNTCPEINLVVFDPMIERAAIETLGLKTFDQAEVSERLSQADLVVILVAHSCFKEPLKNIEIDKKRIFDPIYFLDSAKIGEPPLIFKL